VIQGEKTLSLQFVRVLDASITSADIEGVSAAKGEVLLSLSRKEAEKRWRMPRREAPALAAELDRYAEFIARAQRTDAPAGRAL